MPATRLGSRTADSRHVRRRGRGRRRALAVAAIALAGAALVAWLPVDSTPPGHPRADLVRRANGDLKALATKVARRVEALRGLRFEGPLPRVVTMDRTRLAALGRRLSRRSRRHAERSPGRLERATRLRNASVGFEQLAGLLPPEITYSPDTSAGVERIGGAYDPGRDRVVIAPGAIKTRDQLRFTLAHELAHALESRHFHLRLKELTAPGEAAEARRALIEGTSTYVQARYQRRFLGDDVPIESRLEGLRSLIGVTDVPYAVRAEAAFDYVDGGLFARSLHSRSGGWDAVNRALRHPPRNTSQILHPRFWPGPPVDQPVHLRTREALTKRWRLVGGGHAGEAEALVILFANHIALEARAGASGWVGGRFQLWRAHGASPACEATCAVGDIAMIRFRWRERLDVDQFALAAPQYMIVGLHADRIENGVWGLPSGYAALGNGARTSTLVFAPSARLAGLLSGNPAASGGLG